MTAMRKRMLSLLNETVEYYSADVKRRAFNGKNGCHYMTHDGRKCAIGRLLTEEEMNIWKDGSLEYSQMYIRYHTPKALLGLKVQFIVALQTVHDHSVNWNNTGISQHGEQFVMMLKSKIEDGEFDQ